MPKYLIHDNGGRPFMVDVNTAKKSINVYKPRELTEVEEDDINKNRYTTAYHTTLVLHIPRYKKVFIGEDPAWKEALGNSILVCVRDHEYISIGMSIYSFVTEDEIISYQSHVGNSDVPYPYAIGKKYIYFIIEKSQAPMSEFSDFDIFEDPYMKLYGHNVSQNDKNKRKMHELWKSLYVKNMKTRTLVKRLW